METDGKVFHGGFVLISPLWKKTELIKIIFRVLGTPTNETWKGVEDLPEYKPQFPRWKPKDLSKMFPSLEPSGVDLLKVS